MMVPDAEAHKYVTPVTLTNVAHCFTCKFFPNKMINFDSRNPNA